MSKAEIEHKDKLGRVLKVGDCVAYPERNTLVIGTIQRLSPKMTMVAELGKKPGWYVIRDIGNTPTI